jgi:hypothetical protein
VAHPSRGGGGHRRALVDLGVGLAGLVGQHAEHPVGAGHGPPQAGRVVQAGRDQLSASCGQPAGSRVGGVADQGPHPPAAIQQVPRDRAALVAGRAKDQDRTRAGGHDGLSTVECGRSARRREARAGADVAAHEPPFPLLPNG